MTNGQRLSTEPRRHDSDVVQLALLRRRLRSRALLVVLLALAGLFYAMTVARFGERRAPKDGLAVAPLMVAQTAPAS
jgi:hypothetical protein